MKQLVTEARPEIALLFACARINPDSKEIERIQKLAELDLDWRYLIVSAQNHGLVELLYCLLKTNCSALVPEAILNNLREHCQNNAQRNLFFTKELIRILDLFEKSGIDSIPYKGPTLAFSVYGDLALREFCDLDILVHPKDVFKAKNILASLGYEPQFQLTGEQEKAFFRYGCEHLFTHGESGAIVEIQWAIAPNFFSLSLDYDRMRGRLNSINLAGRQIMIFSPEDLLLILCIHGGKHLWGRLEWVCGVAELIQANRALDWQLVLEQAEEAGARRLLLLGLALSHYLLGAELPEQILRMIKADSMLMRLVADVLARLFRDDYEPPGLFKSARFHLKSRERLRDKMRYCYRLMMTPTVEDWREFSKPPSFPLLYFPLRAFRLIRKYGPQFLSRKRT